MATLILPEYDLETDVVVVGYGFAGAVAAITAHDHGASVTIIEKMPQPGGNSRVSGGNCLVPKRTKEAVEGFTEYLKTLGFGTTDPEIIEQFVIEALTQKEWIAQLGGELIVPDRLIVSNTYPRTVKGPGFPAVHGGNGTFEKHCLKGEPDVPPSKRMWELLSRNVKQRGIKVLTNTPATNLVKNDAGEIEGVIAESCGKRLSIMARKAVVMTCGGFENNSQLKWDYLPAKPIRFVGNPGNTGDGIRMVQKIGGDLWHMTRSSCVIGFQAPEFEAAFGIFFPSEGFIYVDRYGKRYANEVGVELHEFYRLFSYFDIEHVRFPRIPSWGIFNDETRRAGPLTWSCCGYNRDFYTWSSDNSKEVERGWIVRAETIDELARKVDVDPVVLKETIGRYNRQCATGDDSDFGRSRESLKPLDPPYYAIPLHPAVLNTQGGAKRDARARIIDTDGRPIPRLYSAGEFGSIWGYLYQGANNITECIVFGRIAGRNAAAESLREFSSRFAASHPRAQPA